MKSAVEAQERMDLVVEAIAQVQREGRPSRPPRERAHAWASGYRPCAKAMALDMSHPEDQPDWTADQLYNFERGKEREVAITKLLLDAGQRLGFEVIEQQHFFDVRDRDGTKLVTGKWDGRLDFKDGFRPVFEIKTGRSFDRVESIDDFDDGVWTIGKAEQLLIAMYHAGERYGAFIMESPGGGLPRIIAVDLERHLDRVERSLQQVRTAVDWVRLDQSRREPLPLYDDRSYCQRVCAHYGKTCNPDDEMGTATRLVTDEALQRAASTFVATLPAAKQHERAKTKLKGALYGCERALVGAWVVEGKNQTRRRRVLELPDDEKARLTEKYERVIEGSAWSFSVRGLDGDGGD